LLKGVIKRPPVTKFTRSEIIAAALNLTRREGFKAVTARGLGTELGTSSRPVFTAFQNMDEVHKEIITAARELYNSYVDKGLAEEIAFKGVGMQYIRFAREEPNLFGLLFMTPGKTAFMIDDILPAIDENSERILESIQKPYGLSREHSIRMYQNMWVFTHGIACLCATGVSRLTEDEAGARLTEVFIGLLTKIKSGESKSG
jgi:AcrR family transcriptional regulator